MKLPFNKSNILEYYVTFLLALGLPLVALIYFDWRAALATFVVVQTVVGLLALRTPAPEKEAAE
jgi:energy-converting hydrogenase Eha subunit E